MTNRRGRKRKTPSGSRWTSVGRIADWDGPEDNDETEEEGYDARDLEGSEYTEDVEVRNDYSGKLSVPTVSHP